MTNTYRVPRPGADANPRLVEIEATDGCVYTFPTYLGNRETGRYIAYLVATGMVPGVDLLTITPA